jgi:hypothetical protein
MFRSRRGDNIKIDAILLVKSELFLSVLGWELVLRCCAQGDDDLCPIIQNNF